MKAKIHGIEVEGTIEEILKMKDELDKREEAKHNFKITYHFHQVDRTSPTAIEDQMSKLMREYPQQTWI